MTLPALLAELELLESKAVPAPWYADKLNQPAETDRCVRAECGVNACTDVVALCLRDDEFIAAMRNNFKLLLSLARQQQGCVSVPVEPTNEMLWAAEIRGGNYDDYGQQSLLTSDECREVYKAMLQAAPQAGKDSGGT